MDQVDPTAAIPLRVTHHGTLRLDFARDALARDELSWLGGASAGDAVTGQRTFRCDLRLPLRAVGHDVEFRKAAIVELGRVREDEGGLRLDVCWRSATLAPLFPVFAGQLTVTSDRVDLEGWYAPPGGTIGAAIDRVLLKIAARRTAAWFLRLVAEALGSAPARAEQQQYAKHDDHDRPQRAQLRNASDPA